MMMTSRENFTMKKNPIKKENIDFTPKYAKFKRQFVSVTAPSPAVFGVTVIEAKKVIHISDRVKFSSGIFKSLLLFFLDLERT